MKKTSFFSSKRKNDIQRVKDVKRDVSIINASGVFDDNYYSLRYPDVRVAGFEPLWHFCEHGWKEGRDPNKEFDTLFYLSDNPDVAAIGMNPLVHWILHGRQEGRRAVQAYSQSMFRRPNSGGAISSIASPMQADETDYSVISRSGQFDEQYYLKNNPDVSRSGLTALDHFCRFGWKEGRSPCPDFNVIHYLRNNPDVAALGINPFVHWLVRGQDEKRSGTASLANTREEDLRDDCFNPSILFVSHEASRTGAPMVLLSVLRWIKENTDIEFGIIIGADGPLREEFEAMGPCLFMDAYPPEKISNVLRRFCGLNVQSIYLNTIVSGIYGAQLTFLNAKFITHVHEMENLFLLFEDTFRDLLTFCSDFIAVSQGSQEAIERRSGKQQLSITRIAPFIHRLNDGNTSPTSSGTAFSRKDIPVIYGCGTLEHRKGPDLFCDVAEILLKGGFTNFRMKWIGPKANFDLAGEINRRGIGSHVEWLGAHPNPREILKDGAIFLLPSREDPFPLVCIEAAEQGLPVICFDSRAGSMHSFVETDAGIVVRFLDAEGMASSIKELLMDDERRKELGANAQKKVERLHLAEVICPQILSLLPTLRRSAATDEFEAYKEQIDQAEIVSFDIFDTLITRCLSNPSTVFDVAEYRHSANQAAAIALYDERMRVAGTVLAKYKGERDDISIDEIYADMPFFRDAAIEKSAEIDAVVPHPLGRKIYEYARKAGKRIIIVSDMYLDEVTISSMLRKCGITDWEKLFLSSKLGYKKDTGRLFQMVLTYAHELGIKPGQILHIGDNWEGDVRKAKAAGLKAIRFIPLYDQPYRKFPIAPERARRLSQIGRIWNDFTTQSAKLWKEKNKEAVSDFYMALGFEVSGPLASMMAMYVRAQADKLGIRKVVFMARDGRIIKKAFEALYRKEIEANQYEVIYSHLSRAVVIPATLQNPLSNSDLYFLIEGLHLGQKPLRYFLEKAGLSVHDPEVIAKVKDKFADIEEVPTWADLLAMNLLMSDLSGLIFRANARKREKFAAYLRKMKIDQEKILMVDVGWLLNIQSRFHQFCRDMGMPEQAVGVYVGSRDRVDKSLPHFSLLFDGGDPRHYAEMIEENTTLFEILFSAPEPSATGLVWSQNGEVEVALKSLPMPRSKEFDVARKIHFGAEAFFIELANALDGFMPERISKDFFFAAFEALVQSSDADAHHEFGDFEVLVGGHHEFVAHQNLLKGKAPAVVRSKARTEYFSPMTLSPAYDQSTAIVTAAGLDNGSTRYRGIHLGFSLRAMGTGAMLFHASTDIKQFELEIRDFDTVVFQRCFKGQGNVAAMYDVARRLGKRCVMEIDDLVFPDFLPVIGSVVGGEWSYEEALSVSSSYEEMMNEMDGAITSTKEIGKFIREKWEIPTAIYGNRVQKIGGPSALDSRSLRIIYASGTYSHKDDFSLVSDVVLKILKENPNVTLSLLGATQVPDQLLSLPNVSAYPILPYEMMLSFIGSHHLMIVPLADNIFNHAKSNVKFIECSSVGVPIIASNVTEYAAVIENGKNGLLAETANDWSRYLTMAVQDRSALAQIGRDARTFIEQNYLCSTLDAQTVQSLETVLFQ